MDDTSDEVGVLVLEVSCKILHNSFFDIYYQQFESDFNLRCARLFSAHAKPPLPASDSNFVNFLQFTSLCASPQIDKTSPVNCNIIIFTGTNNAILIIGRGEPFVVTCYENIIVPAGAVTPGGGAAKMGTSISIRNKVYR